jgi:hypothetical protein
MVSRDVCFSRWLAVITTSPQPAPTSLSHRGGGRSAASPPSSHQRVAAIRPLRKRSSPRPGLGVTGDDHRRVGLLTPYVLPERAQVGIPACSPLSERRTQSSQRDQEDPDQDQQRTNNLPLSRAQTDVGYEPIEFAHLKIEAFLKANQSLVLLCVVSTQLPAQTVQLLLQLIQILPVRI